MSARATAWAWDQVLKSHSSKLVLLCLADSHDACSGRVESDLAYIAKLTGLSQSTCRAALAKLVKDGVLTPDRLSVSEAGFSLAIGGAV